MAMRIYKVKQNCVMAERLNNDEADFLNGSLKINAHMEKADDENSLLFLPRQH